MSFTSSSTDTIIALATPTGIGAIAVLRLSGQDAIRLVNVCFKGKNLEKQNSHTAFFGTIRNGNDIIDEVLVTIFVAPHSYTKENVVEISCHGSPYIVQEILQLFINQGVRLARAGEFTQRAFLNGGMDLAQAEAVADLIAADSKAAHRTALNQMRGGFSLKIKQLREKLIHFASLIELELDFGEEDIEFADRKDLKKLVAELQSHIALLVQSFSVGNVLKKGVPVVIAGKPNAGKSTLLNALLNEEKAIVSPIAGTTRDIIEDQIAIEGINFRFIDTAGLRETTDDIEKIGVERAKDRIKQAEILLYIVDLANIKHQKDYDTELSLAKELVKDQDILLLLIGNKIDQASAEMLAYSQEKHDLTFISALQKNGIEELKTKMVQKIKDDEAKVGDTLVANVRHYESLSHTQTALQDVMDGLNTNKTGDFLALDIRQSLHHLGEITGEITTDDLLSNIFSKFCIGK